MGETCGTYEGGEKYGNQKGEKDLENLSADGR
jgi:hypothetical protein